MKLKDLSKKFPHSNDEKKWNLNELHIVAPYPTPEFFEELVSIDYLKPEFLHLYIDDGWPEASVNAISKKLDDAGLETEYKRIAAQPNGFVHAKIYFFKWQNENTGEFRRYILIGSANASKNGFGGHAETYTLICGRDLKDQNDQPAKIEKTYFNRLRQEKKVGHYFANFGENSWISLPAIRVVENKKNAVASFDAWLKRGRLCHKFDPSPNFGKFLITIENKIPNGELKEIFQVSSFIEASSTTQIRYSYLKQGTSTQNTENNKNEQWKAKYFIETNYGHWTSEECHEDKKEDFKSKTFNERKSHIDEIGNIEKERKINKYIDAFIEKIKDLSGRLGENTKKYLKHNEMSAVDEIYYRDLSSNQLKIDIEIAKDHTFRQRYTDGYSFPSCPSMSEEDFEEFARSLCDDLLLEMQKPRQSSLLVKTLKEIEGKTTWNNGGELLNWLRDDKNWDKNYKTITNFWKTNSKITTP